MSKTFKSVTDNESELDVRANDCGVFIAFSRAGQIRQASTFAPSDAPALALAILEAAGVEPGLHEDADFGSQEQIEYLTYGLKKHVEAQERATAEAEAQAELEAEALELRNAYFGDIGSEREWSDLTIGAQSTWITVARRAREINKEEK